MDFTQSLRKNLLDVLISRFEKSMNSDLFVISTLLDPNYGISFIEPSQQDEVIKRVKFLLRQMECNTDGENGENNDTLREKKVDARYVSFSINKPFDRNQSIMFDTMITEFFAIVSKTSITCPLTFWKTYEHQFFGLSKLAKKFLGVPASSANVERMFSISGHIMSNKRRRMSSKL
jgi:hypothetical protein